MAGETGENFLTKLFFHSAKNFPDNIAVTFSGETVEAIKYFDLSKKVKDLSASFKKIFSRNEVVGIYSPDCLNMPTLLLAIMDASAAFYPISTVAKSRKVLENVNRLSIRYILVENGLVHEIYTEYSKRATLEIVDNDLLQAVQFTMLKVRERNDAFVVDWFKDLAYVMQTSGTTGDPKAVFVPHSCIVPNISHLSSIFEITSQDVVYLASPYTFDPSIVQMFLAFYNGAELLITPRSAKLIPRKLCQKLFDQHRVTVFQPTPSLLYYIGGNLISTKLLSENSSLVVLAIGGESCPSLSTLRKWKHPKCKTRLYNIYGITEVSSWATCHHITNHELCVAVDKNASEISSACQLGAPLLKTEIIVYDDNGDVVTGNGVGRLWIGGHDRQCMLEGENEDNIPIFRDSGDIVEVKDNYILYLGRSDNQVKRFGHRINLDYIEKVVREYTDVTSCTLTLESMSTYGKLLHLYVVPNLLDGNTSEDLEKYKTTLQESIMDVLPRESYPDRVHLVGKLPLTDHGKVDKREVSKIVKDRNLQYKDQQSVVEILSEMWIDCIHINISASDKETSVEKGHPFKTPLNSYGSEDLQVNESDMFMLQGGDSFRAVQLAEQIEKWIRKRTGRSVDLAKLFEIISDNIFGSLVSYVEESLRSGEIENDYSPEFDERSNNNKKRIANCDIELPAKTSKIDTRLANRDDNELEIKVCVEEKEICTCFVRRGSERFACASCEDCSECFNSNHNSLLNCSVRELVVKWIVFMEKCIDASPLVVPSCFNGDGEVFIGSHSYLFISVTLFNGEVLWKTRLGGRIESSACLSLCGRLIVVGCYDGKLYVLRRNSGQIIWTYQTQDVIKSSPCLDLKTGLVWVCSYDGCLYGLDVDRMVCKFQVECGGGSCFSSPVVSFDPHLVYCGTLAGCFLCVDAFSGVTKWLKKFEKPIFSSPLIQGDRVLVATVNGYLRCLNYCGEELWEFCTDATVFSSPSRCTSESDSLAGDTIIASHGQKVYRVSSEGKCRWSTLVDGPVYATPCLASFHFHSSKPAMSSLQPCSSSNVCIVSVTTKGTVYILAAGDGRIIKTFSLPGEVFSSPVAVGRSILVGCRNEYLYCIDLSCSAVIS